MPVVSLVLPLVCAMAVGWMRIESRIAVLEARIQLHEQSSTEVSAAVEKRLSTIEADIKLLLQRPSVR